MPDEIIDNSPEASTVHEQENIPGTPFPSIKKMVEKPKPAYNDTSLLNLDPKDFVDSTGYDIDAVLNITAKVVGRHRV